jgi:Flp pilus assembly protein TadD
MAGTVLAVTVLAYLPAISAPQLFDDQRAIDLNPTITHLLPLSDPLRPPASTSVAGRPVVNVTLAFNYWINGVLGVDQQPGPDAVHKTISYHVVNLLLHLGCGLLILGLVRRTLRDGRFGASWIDAADATALVVFALWLLHPLQTDAVDYLIQRTELVVSFCYLMTLYASVRAWDTGNVPSRRLWYALGIAACALGMGSKEVMVSAPLMVVLYDRAFRLTSWRDLRLPAARGRRGFYAALFATLVILAALLATHPRGESVALSGPMPWYEYLHSQGWAVLHYMRLMIWPRGLSLDYGASAVPHWRGVPGLIVLGVIAAATLLAWRRARRWAWLAFLGSWFLLILAPSSSVVPITTEIAAERRMYLPLAAWIVLSVVAAVTLLRWRPASRRVVIAAAWCVAAVAVVFAVITFRRSELYRDPVAIWRDAVAQVPDNGRAWYSLGVALSQSSPAQPDEADYYYRGAVARDSTYADALLRLVASDLHRGDTVEARHYLHQFPLAHGNDTVLAGMGRMLLLTGDTSGALVVFQRAVEAPGDVDDIVDLGKLFLAAHRPDDAVRELRVATAMTPTRNDLLVFLAGVLIDLHHPGDAAPYLERAVERSPNSGMILALISLDDADEGKRGAATEEAARAADNSNGEENTWFVLGRAMLDNGRADLAGAYLERAIALNPVDADAVADLGVANDDLGHRAEAEVLYRRALAIAPNDSVARARIRP